MTSTVRGRKFRANSCKLLMLVLMVLPGWLSADNNKDGAMRIGAIKAAFVLNIARFVTWPNDVFADDREAIDLCLYRQTPYEQALDSISGKMIGQRPIRISRIQTLTHDHGCEVLLVPQAEAEDFRADIDKIPGRPVLTIADNTGADELKGKAQHGIVVSLVRQGSRIAFEINPWLAQRMNLKMSSELLKLARIVGEP